MLHLLNDFVDGSREEKKEKFLEVTGQTPDLSKPINSMDIVSENRNLDVHSRIFLTV